VLAALGVSRKAWPEIFRGLQVMERAALEAMSETARRRKT
jgi:hypothetical protein